MTHISEKPILRQRAVFALAGLFLLTGTVASQADETRRETGKEKAIAKFLGKTMKMATRAPFRKEETVAEPVPVVAAPAPVYSRPYPSPNPGLAARFFDPQLKESPINTAMLFKIPLVQAPATKAGTASPRN